MNNDCSLDEISNKDKYLYKTGLIATNHKHRGNKLNINRNKNKNKEKNDEKVGIE